MKLLLQDLTLRGKKVLLRVDYNVPLHSNGMISDDTRIKESLPSIQYILQKGGSIILMSHLGRPEGNPNPKFSLSVCAQRLSELLKLPVVMATDCIGTKVKRMAQSLQPSQILCLENLRFHSAEEDPTKDPTFAKQLAALADCYVNDAFGAAHRKHSSTVTITQYFPQQSAAGFLIQKEMQCFETLLSSPKMPFHAIIGGSKISTKMGLLKTLITKVSDIYIGGGMAFTFFKAKGLSIGNSIYEETQLSQALTFLEECKSKAVNVWLPEDCVIAETFSNNANAKTVPIHSGIPNGWQGMDIGENTIHQWKLRLKKSQTIFWNGPLGVFELPKFSHGTKEIAKFLVTLQAVTIVGGGDSVAAVNQLHLSSKFSHVSTGGGAALEWIEFGHLPGIDALSEK